MLHGLSRECQKLNISFRVRNTACSKGAHCEGALTSSQSKCLEGSRCISFGNSELPVLYRLTSEEASANYRYATLNGGDTF